MEWRVFYKDSWGTDKTTRLEADNYWKALDEASKLFKNVIKIDGVCEQAKRDKREKEFLSKFNSASDSWD